MFLASLRDRIFGSRDADFFHLRAHERYSVDRDYLLLPNSLKLPLRDISVGGISVLLTPQARLPLIGKDLNAQIVFQDEEPIDVHLKSVRIDSYLAAFRFTEETSAGAREKLAELLEPLNVGASLRMVSNDLRPVDRDTDVPTFVYRGLANCELSVWVPHDAVSKWSLVMGRFRIQWSKKDGLMTEFLNPNSPQQFSPTETLDPSLLRNASRIFMSMPSDSGLSTILKRTLVRKI